MSVRTSPYVIVVLIAVMAVAACNRAPDVDEEARAAASRAVVQEFATDLRGQLQAAMAAGGPSAAIGVCKEVAPAIAASLSEREGWQVARTSHRLRNPANAPDAHEAAVLERFLTARAEGIGAETLEEFGIVDMADGTRSFRYMKAIPAEGPCLACHGAAIAPEVAAAIAEAYPQDRATGFVEGDVRGAFTIIQPLDG